MFNVDKSAKEVLEEIGLTEEKVAGRLALLGITERDRNLLQRNHSWLADVMENIAGEFTKEFAGTKEFSHAIPQGHSDAGFASTLRDYILDLADVRYDTDYANRRLKVGLNHQRRGVTEELYIGAYSWILDALMRAAYAGQTNNTEYRVDLASALMKIVLFDIGLALEAYAHANHQSIEYLAKHDHLTGLSNYNLLIEDLERRLKRHPSSGAVYVLFIGLNRFKSVNETLGHPIGDEILKETAARLTDIASRQCLVSRLGGDIFVIIAGGRADSPPLPDLTQNILTALQAPFDLSGFSVNMEATIGAGITDDIAVDAVSLMRQAEMAMYHAKVKQLPTAVFEVDMKRYSAAHLSLSTELRNAIDSDELVLFYQPKIELSNETVVGVEALIRWIHPVKGFMPPGRFIPLAEQTVLIHPLTDWVLKTAVAQAAEWRRMGINLVMSVNLAAPNLQNQKLPEFLSALLKDHAVKPSALMLEITESGLMADPHRALNTVKQFRDLGVKLSIDDFGTGYSSLSYLKTLPVDEVKVDQTFVFGMTKEQKDDQIVRATINLGHSLGLQVAAEGVEDRETVDILKSYGCDTVQGFLYSKPLPADEFISWLKKRAEWNKTIDANASG
jgi:diguanylate cyclase (GGDEF)-like protein